jgi:gamma-glutamyl-gamma-aminobutyrate hydrolase PuuD
LSNIVIVNGPSYASPYVKLAEELGCDISTNKNLVLDNPKEVSLVVFTGGSDVTPSVYNEKAHKTTNNNIARDEEELEIFVAAKNKGIPMAGICRGSQFLCAMAGGKLVQHITNHAGPMHNIVVTMPDDEIRVVKVTSSHHQMQYPFALPEEDYEVIGWSEEQRSTLYCMNPDKTIRAADADDNLKSEPDIVWYPKIKALGVQYHPEWMPEESEGFTIYEELVDLYLKPEIIKNDQRRKTSVKTLG